VILTSTRTAEPRIKSEIHIIILTGQRPRKLEIVIFTQMVVSTVQSGEQLFILMDRLPIQLAAQLLTLAHLTPRLTVPRLTVPRLTVPRLTVPRLTVPRRMADRGGLE
jgi:hypothetical protein